MVLTEIREDKKMNKGKERRGGDWLTLYFNNITREHRLQVNFFNNYYTNDMSSEIKLSLL